MTNSNPELNWQRATRELVSDDCSASEDRVGWSRAWSDAFCMPVTKSADASLAQLGGDMREP
jgi:hypothetical protein